MWLLSIFLLLRANIFHSETRAVRTKTGKMPIWVRYIWCGSIQSISLSPSHTHSLFPLICFPIFQDHICYWYVRLTHPDPSCDTRAFLWLYRERVLVHTHRKKISWRRLNRIIWWLKNQNRKKFEMFSLLSTHSWRASRQRVEHEHSVAFKISFCLRFDYASKIAHRTNGNDTSPENSSSNVRSGCVRT